MSDKFVRVSRFLGRSVFLAVAWHDRDCLTDCLGTVFCHLLTDLARHRPAFVWLCAYK